LRKDTTRPLFGTTSTLCTSSLKSGQRLCGYGIILRFESPTHMTIIVSLSVVVTTSIVSFVVHMAPPHHHCIDARC